MKALLTGITGQDASYLTEFLLEKGYEVHGLIRRTSSPNTRWIRQFLYDSEVFNKTFFLHDGDMADGGSLNRIVKDVQPDEVYNFACMAGVSPSFFQPEFTHDTGGMGVLRLLEAIKVNAPLAKFFQAGSSHIFGNTKESPQNELTRFSPISPYGVAKAHAQLLLNEYREKGNFACSAIYYAHASPRYSESFLLSKIVHSIWRIMKGEQKYLEVGHVDVLTDVGFAKEYAEAAWHIMQQPKPQDFIICTGETHTAREFMQIAFETAGLEMDKYVRFNPALKRSSEVAVLVGDYSKAQNAFGYKPSTPFQDLVSHMVKDV